MSNREFEEQFVYDRLKTERSQEEAMDRKLLADNKALARRLKAG